MSYNLFVLYYNHRVNSNDLHLIMLTLTMTMADPVFVKYSDASNNETMHILLFDIVNEVTLNRGVRIQRYRSVFNIYDLN